MAKRSVKIGTNDIQVPLYHAAEPDWHPPLVSSLPAWPEHGRVSIDVETCDPKLKELGPGVRRGAYIVGYSFAIEDGPAFYLPLRHASGDNVADVGAAISYLRDNAARFKGTLVGANLQYDLDFLAEEGVEFPQVAWHRDVQIADPLIWELHDRYSLQAIALRRGLESKNETALVQACKDWGLGDPKDDLWRLPGRYVSPYAIGDVELPLKILRKQEADIEREDLQQIFDLESRVLPVLMKMRRRGVRIDQAALQRVEDFAIDQCKVSLALVKDQTGRQLVMDDVMKARAIAPVLQSIGVKLDETACGLPSIDAEVLGALDHPVAKALHRARRLHKLKNTFVASIREHMINGRIHCTFNQLRGDWKGTNSNDDEKGAKFGRLSSSDPNLQQQPARDPEFAKMWRSIFIPEEGMLWCAADYSQQEPRVLTHYAELTGCTKAMEFGDFYRNDPKFDTYDGLSKMTRLKRSDAKQTYLGLSYSMGGPKLCKKINRPTVWRPDPKTGYMREFAGPEGEAVMKSFHTGAPFIRELDRKIRDRIQETGYIRTLLGRKVHFPEFPIPKQNPWTGRMEKYDWAQKGLNRLVQGSSADQVKKAVVELDAQGHFLQLQVHDEIDGSVFDEAEGHRMGETMRNCVKLTVPMRVDVEFGDSWGASMG